MYDAVENFVPFATERLRAPRDSQLAGGPLWVKIPVLAPGTCRQDEKEPG